MEFKLGATLWGPPAQSRPPAANQITARDFEKKLGLPLQPSRSLAAPPPPAQNQKQEHRFEGQEVPEQVLLTPTKGTATVTSAELYGWGNQAGPHLSHLPGGFQGAEGDDATLFAAQAVAAADIVPAVPRAVAAPTDMQTDYTVRGSPQTLRESHLCAAPKSTIPGQPALSHFFAQHWPERRVLILPRESGSEILIRDFYMSSDEQQALALALRDFMNNSETRVQQVWINGQRLATSPT